MEPGDRLLFPAHPLVCIVCSNSDFMDFPPILAVCSKFSARENKSFDILVTLYNIVGNAAYGNLSLNPFYFFNDKQGHEISFRLNVAI